MSSLYFWGKQISASFATSKQPAKKSSNIISLPCSSSINSISCGAQHCTLITQQNQLFSFGSNLYGQMGLCFLPHANMQISRIFIPTKRKIVSISTGWYHTLALDQLGELYVTGKGEDGATGLGIKANTFGFVSLIKDVRKISAGKDHSLALKGTKVYGWGSNEHGQLALHSKKKYFTPQQLNIYPCNEISAGAKFSIFTTVKGLYVCGINNDYQLGLGHQKQLHYAKSLEIQQQIEKVWTGNYCFAKSKSKTFYVWGTGAFGIFKYPTKMPFFNTVSHIAIGQSIGFAKKDDKIYVWGTNQFNQLALGSHQQSKQFAYENNILSQLDLDLFACGGNFAVGVANGAISHEKVFKNSQIKDFINQRQYSQNILSQPQKFRNASEKSFYSSIQDYSRFNNAKNHKSTNYEKQRQNLVKSHKRQLKYDNLKQIQAKSQSQSYLTVKRKCKKAQDQQDNKNLNQSKIQYLSQQVVNLKQQIQQKGSKNNSLAIQNQQLKQLLKQQLLKQVFSQYTSTLSQNNYTLPSSALSQTLKSNLLKIELKQKQKQFTKLRQDYFAVNNIVENNIFLRNLLGMKQQWIDPQKQKLNYFKQSQIQQFGGRLQQLKTVLKQVKLNQSSQ